METKIREVVPGIFLVHLPLPMRPTIVNVYLLHSGDEWALIDTGMSTPHSVAAFRAALAAVGCAPEAIRKIICTHHHPDHFGTSKAYKELTGATLYLHRAEYERSQTFLPSDRPEEAVRFFLAHGIPLSRFANVPRPRDIWGGLYVTTPPDVHIDDGDSIALGDFTIEVIWTPGHAPGHGVDIDEKLAARYPYKSAYLPVARLRDGTMPWLGLCPNRPQKWAGTRIEPPISEPSSRAL